MPTLLHSFTCVYSDIIFTLADTGAVESVPTNNLVDGIRAPKKLDSSDDGRDVMRWLQ